MKKFFISKSLKNLYYFIKKISFYLNNFIRSNKIIFNIKINSFP